jgi:hypothetical protein
VRRKQKTGYVRALKMITNGSFRNLCGKGWNYLAEGSGLSYRNENGKIFCLKMLPVSKAVDLASPPPRLVHSTAVNIASDKQFCVQIAERQRKQEFRAFRVRFHPACVHCRLQRVSGSVTGVYTRFTSVRRRVRHLQEHSHAYGSSTFRSNHSRS